MCFEKAARATLRINCKSLSSELKHARFEMRRTNDPDIASSIRSHVDYKISAEARTSFLALAVINGMPYGLVERKCRIAPDFDAVKKKIARHCHVSSCTEKFNSWYGEARTHLLATAAGD